MESLALGFPLTNNLQYLIELPNLKSLQLNCAQYNNSINSILQTLSDSGVIEKLEIMLCVLEAEALNAEPLVFNKLREICFKYPRTLSSLLRALTKSQMREIRTLELTFSQFEPSLETEIMKFIESKTTLKSVRLFSHKRPRLEFIRQIIEILKIPCTPKRPFLHFEIMYDHAVSKEVVRWHTGTFKQ